MQIYYLFWILWIRFWFLLEILFRSRSPDNVFNPRTSCKTADQYLHAESCWPQEAITNQRIVNIADGKVTFVAKDYRQGAVKKLISLEGVEFLRRFCLHILPRRFVKIRHFGICNHTVKRNLEIRFRVEDKSGINTKTRPGKTAESTIERFERLTGINPCRCKVCKSGRMLILRKLPPIRSPTYHHFAQTQPQL